jgi:hypothetical protein
VTGQTGQSDETHSPDEWASVVVSRITPAASSIEVVWTVAISCRRTAALNSLVPLHRADPPLRVAVSNVARPIGQCSEMAAWILRPPDAFRYGALHWTEALTEGGTPHRASARWADMC